MRLFSVPGCCLRNAAICCAALYLEDRLAYMIARFVYLHALFRPLFGQPWDWPRCSQMAHSERHTLRHSAGELCFARLSPGVCSSFKETHISHICFDCILFPVALKWASALSHVLGVIFSVNHECFIFWNCQGKYISTGNGSQKA